MPQKGGLRHRATDATPNGARDRRSAEALERHGGTGEAAAPARRAAPAHHGEEAHARERGAAMRRGHTPESAA